MVTGQAPGGDEAVLAAVGAGDPSTLRMGGLEFALGDVALDVDLDLARADLVGVELCVGLDHLEVGHRLELEGSRAELLEVVEGCNCVQLDISGCLPLGQRMSTELTLVLHDDGLASGNDDIGSVVDGLEVNLELDTGEVGDEAVLADRKGARRVVVVENCAELEHLDILGTGVRDGSGDLDVVDRVNLTWCC